MKNTPYLAASTRFVKYENCLPTKRDVCDLLVTVEDHLTLDRDRRQGKKKEINWFVLFSPILVSRFEMFVLNV